VTAPANNALTNDRADSDVVLIVDDVPDNLSLLHDALEESGYTVLVATSGEAALLRAAQGLPDIVLLDAVMPGMDGFEVARQLKASPLTAHIPIIFMTGLTETEHLVAALEAGGVDYLTKPIKAQEMLARMGVHLQGARRARQQVQVARQARSALDAFGYASITVRLSDGRISWQTPLARELLESYFDSNERLSGLRVDTITSDLPDAHGWPVLTLPPSHTVPAKVLDWLRRNVPYMLSDPPPPEPPRLVVEHGARRLTFRLHQQAGDSEGGGDWLLVMREVNDAAIIEAMSLSFKLTSREAEVLYWVVKGKINRDIGDILGASPATVKKHLERVFAKLGVETRTAAAGMAMGRIRQLHPHFEG